MRPQTVSNLRANVSDRRAAIRNLPTSDSALQPTQTAVVEARAALASAQVAASTLDSDTAQGRSQNRLQQQRFLAAEIDLALAEEGRARSSAKYWWTALRTDTDADLAVLEEQVLEWSELVRDIEQRAPDWRSDTEAELLAVQSQNRDGLDRAANRLLDQRLETAQQTLAKEGELVSTGADLELLMQVVDVAIADYSGAFKSWLASMSRAAKTAYMRVMGLADTTLFSVGETPVTGGDILRVIIILTVAMLLSRGIQWPSAASAPANTAARRPRCTRWAASPTTPSLSSRCSSR